MRFLGLDQIGKEDEKQEEGERKPKDKEEMRCTVGGAGIGLR